MFAGVLYNPALDDPCRSTLPCDSLSIILSRGLAKSRAHTAASKFRHSVGNIPSGDKLADHAAVQRVHPHPNTRIWLAMKAEHGLHMGYQSVKHEKTKTHELFPPS